MNSRRAIPSVAAALCLGMLASCASTTMVGSWIDPAYSGGRFLKVMVVGVARREVLRRVFEDTFTERLSSRGVEGIASFAFAPGAEELDRDVLTAKVAELGCDGVLVTRLIDKRTRLSVYPPTGYAVPVAYHGGYYAYYRGAYAVAYSPGYAVETTTVSLETNLYDARTGQLTWSGLTETIVSDDPASQADELIRVLVDKLAASGLIR